MKIYKIKVNGKTYRVELEAIDEVSSEKPTEPKEKVEEKKAEPAPKNAPTAEGRPVESPIQGNVINIKVKPGDQVKKGDSLLVIEAMKLENDVVSPFDGEVAEVLVNKGQNVAAKDVVVIIK